MGMSKPPKVASRAAGGLGRAVDNDYVIQSVANEVPVFPALF